MAATIGLVVPPWSPPQPTPRFRTPSLTRASPRSPDRRVHDPAGCRDRGRAGHRLGRLLGRTFTVFAPTNDAFAALDADLLAAALGDPDGLLTDILNYHVVPGNSGRRHRDVDIAHHGTGRRHRGRRTVLNGSVNITGTDNFACNGVVHVIDAVLVPELPSIATVATEAGFRHWSPRSTLLVSCRPSPTVRKAPSRCSPRPRSVRGRADGSRPHS